MRAAKNLDVLKLAAGTICRYVNCGVSGTERTGVVIGAFADNDHVADRRIIAFQGNNSRIASAGAYGSGGFA